MENARSPVHNSYEPLYLFINKLPKLYFVVF